MRAHEILNAWISPSFAANATETMQILAVGFVISLLAPLSGALLNGIGRPDIVAKLYVVELPLNIVSVWALTHAFGINGAAWSFVLRSVFETGLLWILVGRTISFSQESIAFARRLGTQAALTLMAMGTLALLLRGGRIEDPASIALSLAVLAGYGVVVSLVVLDRQDWHFLKAIARREQLHNA